MRCRGSRVAGRGHYDACWLRRRSEAEASKSLWYHRRVSTCLLPSIFMLMACAAPQVSSPAGILGSDPIRAAVEASGRPAEDRARDPDRKPAAVLEFFGVRRGMKVADLMSSGR